MSKDKVNRKVTSVVLRDDQFGWIEKNHINRSKLFRHLLDDEIKRCDGSIQDQFTDAERKIIDLLKARLPELGVKDMGELAALMESGIIKIWNTQLPQISRVGEMPDDPTDWD